MEYRYFVDFQLGISVFATFSYGIVVLGIPNIPLTVMVMPPCYVSVGSEIIGSLIVDTVVGKNIVYKQEKSLYHQLYN